MTVRHGSHARGKMTLPREHLKPGRLHFQSRGRGYDIAFSLCDRGFGTPEIGLVCMREIRELRGRLGLPVERDLHFDADKTLSAYAEEARAHGRIVT